MRASIHLALSAVAILMGVGAASQPVAASGFENPDGFGLYSPADSKRDVYRYDSRSWYYRQKGYYPYYASSYWVPRVQMRYRYRYQYNGPRYRYFPAWGYPRPDYNGPGDRHF